MVSARERAEKRTGRDEQAKGEAQGAGLQVQKLPQPANQSRRQDVAPAGNKFRFGQVRDGAGGAQPMRNLAYLGEWRPAARTWGGMEGAWRVRQSGPGPWVLVECRSVALCPRLPRLFESGSHSRSHSHSSRLSPRGSGVPSEGLVMLVCSPDRQRRPQMPAL